MTGIVDPNRFCVYEHVRTDTGEVFYVGKGLGRRPWNMCDRNKYHKRVQHKLADTGYHVDVRILLDKISEDLAHSLEKLSIRWWKTMALCGPNIRPGGEGHAGVCKHSDETKELLRQIGTRRITSPETRAKISRANKGQPKPLRDPEHNAKISATLKGRLIGERTPDRWEKISKSLIGHPSYKDRTGVFGKAIICLTDGKIWKNARLAAAHYGLGYRNISLCATGRRPKTGGMEFAFVTKE